MVSQQHSDTNSRELLPDGGNNAEFERWREEHASGILYFTRFDVVPVMVDALFDNPPSREFTIDELAEVAGISSRSAKNRINVLEELEIVESASADQIRLNFESEITEYLWKLDSAINERKKFDEMPVHFDMPEEDALSYKFEPLEAD